MNERQGGDLHVLLVDDDAKVRNITAQTLDRLGYRVTQLSDAQDAIGVLEDGGDDVSLIVSDVRMPGMQGDELARIVARRWPRIPMLLISGHARTGDFADGDTFYEVLPKPFSRTQLAKAIAFVRRQKRVALRGSPKPGGAEVSWASAGVFAITCARCRKTCEQPLVWLRNNRRFQCPGCDAVIVVDDASIADAMAKLSATEQSMLGAPGRSGTSPRR